MIESASLFISEVDFDNLIWPPNNSASVVVLVASVVSILFFFRVGKVLEREAYVLDVAISSGFTGLRKMRAGKFSSASFGKSGKVNF